VLELDVGEIGLSVLDQLRTHQEIDHRHGHHLGASDYAFVRDGCSTKCVDLPRNHVRCLRNQDLLHPCNKRRLNFE
jgi:hypothetical protein